MRQLLARGYGVVAAVEQEVTGRLSTVRLGHGSTVGVVVDLPFASCGIERRCHGFSLALIEPQTDATLRGFLR